ncbi:MAG: DUF6141 family protein [Planctomycetota bacterium]|jgi:hypothetical protein
MSEESGLIYREEQRFGLWLRWLIFVSILLAVPLSIFSLSKIPSEEGAIKILPVTVLTMCGIFVPIGIAVLFFALKLETEVRGDGLYIRFYPFHLKFKRFGVEELSEYYAREYRPILEYGGWGIRWGRKGRAYNVSGNKGVQLVFKNGKQLLIGSQREKELEDAIRSIMKDG